MAYFSVALSLCGLNTSTVVADLSSPNSALSLTIGKFASCSAAALQPLVITKAAVIAVAAAVGGVPVSPPEPLPNGAAIYVSSECDAYQAATSSMRQLLQQRLQLAAGARALQSAQVCSNLIVNYTSASPPAALLQLALAAPSSSIYASALQVLLDPIGAVNAVAIVLNAFYAALAAGTATGPPALNTLLQTLVYELSVLPTNAPARRALRARALASSGVTLTVLTVSPLVSIPVNPSAPAPSASSSLSGGAIAGIVIGSVVLVALIVLAVAAAIDRRRRMRRARSVAIRLESARRLKTARTWGPTGKKSPLGVIGSSSKRKPAASLSAARRPSDSALATAVVENISQRSASIRRLRSSAMDMHPAAQKEAANVVSPERAQRSHELTRAGTAQQLVIMPEELAPTTAQRRMNVIAAATAAGAAATTPRVSNRTLVRNPSHGLVQNRAAGGSPSAAAAVGTSNPLHSSRAVVPLAGTGSPSAKVGSNNPLHSSRMLVPQPQAGAASGRNTRRAPERSNPASPALRRSSSVSAANMPLSAEDRRAAAQNVAALLRRQSDASLLRRPQSSSPSRQAERLSPTSLQRSTVTQLPSPTTQP